MPDRTITCFACGTAISVSETGGGMLICPGCGVRLAVDAAGEELPSWMDGDPLLADQKAQPANKSPKKVQKESEKKPVQFTAVLDAPVEKEKPLRSKVWIVFKGCGLALLALIASFVVGVVLLVITGWADTQIEFASSLLLGLIFLGYLAGASIFLESTVYARRSAFGPPLSAPWQQGVALGLAIGGGMVIFFTAVSVIFPDDSLVGPVIFMAGGAGAILTTLIVFLATAVPGIRMLRPVRSWLGLPKPDQK